MSRVIFRAGLWLAAGVALGRLAGFVREAILAARFGRSAEGDAAVLVLTLPDTVINLLVGSAMTVALVPVLAERRPRGAHGPVIRAALVAGTLAGVGLWVGVALAGLPLVALLAPGLPAPAAAAAAGVLPIALAAIPAALISSVLGAVLQERYRTATTALGTLVFNGAVIVGLLVAGAEATLLALAVALLIGAVLRLALQVWDVRRDPPAPVPTVPEPLPPGMVLAYGQALLAGGALLLVPVLGRAFASQAGAGEIAAYTYATKLFELPLGVALTVVAQALFAKLAALRAEGRTAEARELLAQGLTLVGVLAGACTGVLAVGGPVLAEAAFARGRMSVADAHHIGALAALLAAALPLAALASLVTGWLNAGRDTRTPLVAGGLGLLVFAVVAALGSGQVQQVILATVLLHGVVLAVLVLGARQELPWRPGVIVPGMVAGGVSALVAWLVPAEGGLVLRLAVVGMAGVVGLVAGALLVPAVRRRLRRS